MIPNRILITLMYRDGKDPFIKGTTCIDICTGKAGKMNKTNNGE